MTQDLPKEVVVVVVSKDPILKIVDNNIKSRRLFFVDSDPRNKQHEVLLGYPFYCNHFR